MREIIESTLLSLDGVIEDPAAWAGPFIDADFQQRALERLAACDAMLMGRRTYELLRRDWAQQSGEFADCINAMRKYVFSSTLTGVEWPNATLVKDDALAAIHRLKAGDGGKIAVYGHGKLTETLLQAGLLDELQFALFPLVVGRGQRLVRGGRSVSLQLIDATTLPTGVVVLRYRADGA
jgi:dihydrofolate reductase